MRVDAVLVVRAGVLEVIGHARHRRELSPVLLVQVGVSPARVDRAMTDADVREPFTVVGADRYIAGEVGHPVVDTARPRKAHDRVEISPSPHRVATAYLGAARGHGDVRLRRVLPVAESNPDCKLS